MSPAAACYREYAPSEASRGFIRALFSFSEPIEEPCHRPISLEVRFGPGERVCAPTFADGHACIVFNFDKTYNPDGIWRTCPASSTGELIGPLTVSGAPSVPVRRETVGAYLHAGCVIPEAPAPELKNKVIALDEVWGAGARQLAQDLAARRGDARVDCLESAVIRLMNGKRHTESSVDIPSLATWVVASGGQVTVECMAESAGISRQHLTRVFRASVGVSPKTYCELARFQSTLAYVRRGSSVEWAQVAAESGYTDQSHMIAEFRRFTGLTPEALLKGRWFHPFIERQGSRALPFDVWRANRLDPTNTRRHGNKGFYSWKSVN